MTMNIDDPARLTGTPVIGGDGEKLGNVDAVYYDNATDRAEWIAVRGGLFGTRVALVPLRSTDYAGDALRVPFDKVQLRNAPHHDPARDLSSSDEADLYRYYGIDYANPDHPRSADRATGGDDDAAQTVEFAPGILRPGRERTAEHEPVAEPVERIRLARESATAQQGGDRIDDADRIVDRRPI